MKKELLSIVFLFFTIVTFSQEIERIGVKGRIVVKSNDVEGVTVYNRSSNKGTTTDENGAFTIQVALNDRVEFGSLQFKDFIITIDEEILASKEITVFLVEQVNKLDEVLILPQGLTGNLELDVERVKTFNVDMDALYFGIMNSGEYDFSADNRTKVENIAMHSQGQTMINGLNVANLVGLLLKPMFKSNKNKKINLQKNTSEESTISLDDRYDIKFLNQNFGIPLNKIDEFIAYVENNGLDYKLLESGKELEFLEFLNLQSKIFLKAQSDKN